MRKGTLSTLVACAVLFTLALLIGCSSTVRDSASRVPYLDPNIPLVQHIHVRLHIFIDGRQQTIPAKIGLTRSRARAIHTHEADGVIHMETQDLTQYTLKDFFDVWGQPIERPGYTLTMTVNEKANQEYGALVLIDNQRIVLTYTSATH